jgi:tRNA pseudouridine32 synthase/23S rRNA pseudouridine746 synthase
MKSRIYLPKLAPAPATILDYLIAHFPHVPAGAWRERMAEGKIAIANGSTVNADSPYRHGVTILYFREVPDEPRSPVEESVLFQNEHILVVDKPHGMVVTPSGDQVERSLLFRLRKRLGEMDLAPMHRLDRDTAGIVLLTRRVETRGRYHRLFSERLVERVYHAVARDCSRTELNEWHVQNRLEPGEPWYRRRIAAESADEPNAITRIERLDSRNGWGLFRLRPETGKKHQLRIHMASIGLPIAGDTLYPEIRSRLPTDPPLQLLAYRLAFLDPVDGTPRCFTSAQRLLCWPPTEEAGTTAFIAARRFEDQYR